MISSNIIVDERLQDGRRAFIFNLCRNDAKGWRECMWRLGRGCKLKQVLKTQCVRFGDGTEDET